MLVVTPIPLISGSVIRCRPVGILNMADEAGKDGKVVAVPISKLSNLYDHVESIDDLPEPLLAQIAHFFEHYKDLEAGKWVKVEAWGNVEEARAEIQDSVNRFDATANKPNF